MEKQRAFFRSGKSRNIAYRLKALEQLKTTIMKYEKQVAEALRADLHKSEYEAYMTETGMTLSEIGYLLKHTAGWAAKKRIPTPLAQFHARSFTMQEPYGLTLVMSPWNYPFMLSLEPLAGAVAAGNCVILKPSAYAPSVCAVLKTIVSEAFEEGHVAVVEGGRAENNFLLEQKFDYIFFTGSVAVGKQVMEKASKHLTPVTLELGGKSPCIVDSTAKINLAAKRIVFGKFINSGQTCVAPDYVLVHETVEKEFQECVVKWIGRMYGKHPLDHPDYPKIINEKHYDRVLGLLREEQVVTGGCGRKETLQIAPAVLKNVSPDAPVMQEEIFGPILPVITYKTIAEAIEFVENRPKPLAAYFFTEDKALAGRLLNRLSFGGGCVNDTIIHLATSSMGFGGVGESGMGSYHGRKSFETFSHAKSVVDKSTWMDLPIRYMPYNGMKTKLLRMFLK